MATDVRASIAKDFASVDGTEAVTLLQPGATAGIGVAHARRTNQTVEWAEAGQGMVVGRVVTFYFWSNDCAERPKLNARVTDGDGFKYRVVRSELSTMRTRYDVDCVQEAA